jgi:hypothetical protein
MLVAFLNRLPVIRACAWGSGFQNTALMDSILDGSGGSQTVLYSRESHTRTQYRCRASLVRENCVAGKGGRLLRCPLGSSSSSRSDVWFVGASSAGQVQKGA